MSDIVDTIKKLLRLSKSPHPGEAESALQKAFALAARYQVDIEQLDLGDDLNRIVQEAVNVGYRLPLERKLAIIVLESFFNVSAVVAAPRLVLFGTSADIAVAEHVLEFLVAEVRRRCAAQAAEHGRRFTTNRRRVFVQGWFYGVISKLKDTQQALLLQDGSVGIVLATKAERSKAAMHAAFPRLGKTIDICPAVRRRDRDWIMLGYDAGRRTQINPGVAPAAAGRSLPEHQGAA